MNNIETSVKKAATRLSCGEALVNLFSNDSKDNFKYVALDADVGNSTHINLVKKDYKNRVVECFIAEQNMVLVAIGLSSLGFIPYLSTFGCFLTRAYDMLRMNSLTKANIKIYGTHVGVSIGQDGPSQMALEDISMFLSIPNCVVL